MDITEILSECHDCIVDEKNSNGQTALHLGAYAGHANVSHVLIKNGASVNLIDNLQQTALTLAVQEGHLEAMNLLIDCGGNLVDILKIHDQKELVNALLILAAKSRLTCIMEDLIINHGTNVHTTADLEGNHILHIAVKSAKR